MIGRSRCISSMKSTSPSRLVGEHAHQVCGLLQDGPRRALEVDPHLTGDEGCERGLSKARRAVEEQMVQGLPTLLGGRDGDRQCLSNLVLADELVQALRPEGRLHRGVFPEVPRAW